MSVKVRCPGCGEKFHATAAPGEKIRCEHCGQAMRLPGARGGEEARPTSSTTLASTSGTLRFECPACGTKHATPRSVAGKKVRCKGCGAGVRVPADPAAPAAAAPSSRSTPRVPGPPSAPARPRVSQPLPGLPPVERAPTELDIYGLKEAPAAPPGGSPADEFSSPGGEGGHDDVPPPPRAAYGELTAAQKKKIARRAEKADRQKASFAGAGMSVSLGAVLGIAFLGWRIMRWVNRASHAAAVVGSLSGGGDFDEPVDVDPRVAAAEADRDVESELKKATLEAREWLDAAKHPDHGVFEMGRDNARKMVEGFYERGAVAVYVLDPTRIGKILFTAAFAIKLPTDPAQRKKIFEWEAECFGLEPDELTADHGQHYLTVATD